MKRQPVKAGATGGRGSFLAREGPLEGRWQPTPVFLLGQFHRQRSLAGCSPRGRKPFQTTERLSTYACAAVLKLKSGTEDKALTLSLCVSHSGI